MKNNQLYHHNIIITHAEEAEYFFRIGMDASGNEKITLIIDNLSKILSKYSYIKLLLLNSILKKILLAQKTMDWIQLADILHYELTSHLTDNLSKLNKNE